MANLQCLPATNVTTQDAILHGTGDNIPVGNFLRIDYSTSQGGPYSTLGNIQAPGNNTVGQPVDEAALDLSPVITYYYVVREIDNDGVTILDTSEECSFTTLSYEVSCEVLSAEGENPLVIRVCANYVAPDQELQVVSSTNSGGPYTTVEGSVPGTFEPNQCQIFQVPLDECEALFLKGRVTPVPAVYVVDWQYAHMNRSGVDETVQLGLGPQIDWVAAGGEAGNSGFGGLTVVDTHVATGASQGTWTLRSGTDFPVPAGVTQLHMGFMGSGGTFPTSGNFLDATSIVLRQVSPSAINYGEQLVNRDFEFPAKVCPGTWEYVPEATPGIAWQTSDPNGANLNGCAQAVYGVNVLGPIEYWDQAGTGFAPYMGTQYAELNAEHESELYQVVNLAVNSVDSLFECQAFAFNAQADCAGANVASDRAFLCGSVCAAPGYWWHFQYGLCGQGFTHATPLQAITQTGEQNFCHPATNLECEQCYDFRMVIYNPTFDPVFIGPVCQLTTLECPAQWCGGQFDPDNCIPVDFDGDGDNDYFNCNIV